MTIKDQLAQKSHTQLLSSGSNQKHLIIEAKVEGHDPQTAGQVVSDAIKAGSLPPNVQIIQQSELNVTQLQQLLHQLQVCVPLNIYFFLFCNPTWPLLVSMGR